MNPGLAPLAIGAVILCPAAAFAAEAEPVEGSWLPLIFYAINFLLFLWAVRRYGWPAIIRFFQDRGRALRTNRERAEKNYSEARELADRAAERLRQLEAEKSKIASELDEETAHQMRQIDSAAHEALSRIRRDAGITLAALREGAQRRLRQTVAEAAGRIARELVRINLQAPDQDRLLEGFIEHIGEEARQ